MARTVFYETVGQPDGTISAIVTMEPDKAYTRDGFKSHAEVAEWVEGLRALMEACGAPVVSLDAGDGTVATGTKPEPSGRACL